MMFADGRAENFKGNLEDKQVSDPPYPEKNIRTSTFYFPNPGIPKAIPPCAPPKGVVIPPKA